MYWALFGTGDWEGKSATQFSNRCTINKVAKVVHGNRSDNHHNRSDTLLPIQANTLLPSPLRTRRQIDTHTRTHARTHTQMCHTHCLSLIYFWEPVKRLTDCWYLFQYIHWSYLVRYRKWPWKRREKQMGCGHTSFTSVCTGINYTIFGVAATTAPGERL